MARTRRNGKKQSPRRSAPSRAATTRKKRPPESSDTFPVVGIGASAGGLEAFTKLLSHLPADTGMAFVLVQHLDPTRESMLTEILARSTKMPIQEVRDGMRIQNNNVYVVPANANLGLVDGSFRLDQLHRERGRDMSIDHFLRSLAEHYTSRAIGVVLSGTLSDGSLGLRAIKAEGGVTFAQDEASARFNDMPRAAVASGAVDFILPPEKIARELVRMGKHPYIRPAPPPVHVDEPRTDAADQRRVLSILKTKTGVDFSNYRQSTLRRRIARRMALRHVDSLRSYADLLRRDPNEIRALHEDILITVTAFFRDPDVYKRLAETVFPSLLRDRAANSPIRIWVPGCSTGEEAYSIVIALFEALQESETQPPILIFATDLSEAAIQKARAGTYLDNALADVSPERLQRFFIRTEAGWQVSKSIRNVCIFARQNLTTDPPFSNLDLISCRNLLIYLEPVLQKRVLPTFHYALRPGGYLVLGSAETITGFSDLFAPLDRAHRIFVKRPGSARQSVDFDSRRRTEDAAARAGRAAPDPTLELQKEVDRLVLNRYGPASVLIDDRGEIIQFRGRTSAYLEPAPGTASLNVFKMARRGILVPLQAAILRTRKTGRPVRKENLSVRQDGHSAPMNLEVVPIRAEDGRIGHHLVLFETAARRLKPDPAARKRQSHLARAAGHDAIVALEQELTATKEYLQATIEAQEASNEELKSANEEILSANEELQSTNEELETAKEELQSTNEELHTVNEELESRNFELTQLNNDFLNLLSGAGIPIVLLGPEGRLRRFTVQAEKLLNLSALDVGRRIAEIKQSVTIADLDAIVSDVITNVASHEREIQDDQGNWYLMRARPYRTVDNRTDGAVLGFFDIDPLKRSLEQVNRAREYAEALVETVREALLVLDGQLRIRAANQSFYRTFQTTPVLTEGKDFLEMWGLDKEDPTLRSRLSKLTREAPLHDYELDVDVETLGHKTLLLNARRVSLAAEAVLLMAIDDITERKAAENALKTSESRYRRIFETAREGIWLLDGSSGEILDVNPYLIELLGVYRDQLVGRRPWDIGLFENPNLAKQRFREAKANGISFEAEVAMLTRDGQRVVVEAITNTYDLRGHSVMQGNLRDVTERVRLEDQLRQVQKLDSIGRLAGGIAHDFNNLLNIISAHVSLLQRSGDAKKRTESAAAIQKAVERGTAVVRQLLTFARKGEPSYEPTDVNGVVREVTSMLRETFPKQVRVSTKLDANVPRIHADPNQIHQAVLNLAVNARDAMREGGTLTLGTSVADGENLRARFPEAQEEKYVEVCVSDTGTGMDEETRRRIFEPFFTTKGTGGQGLGLAVVYGIVNGHRGFIDVESAAGNGTTFRIYLPASDHGGPPPGDPEPTRSRRVSTSSAQERRGEDRVRADSGGAPTVLLVEDEEALLAPIRDLLEEEGFSVLTAVDGIEAVETHARHADRISAVLLDLSLPRLGGWQAFLKMRERDPKLKCVIASGNIDAEQREAMGKYGVRVLIRKPYGSGEMLQAVRKVLADA